MEGTHTKTHDLAPGFESFDTFDFVDEDPFKRWPDLRQEKIGLVNTPEQLTIRLWQDVYGWTTPQERSQLAVAIDIAGYIEGFKVRKDGTPTITHALRNANRLTKHYGIRDIEMVTAMILHDTIEDGADTIVAMAEENEFLDEKNLEPTFNLFRRAHSSDDLMLYRHQQIQAASVLREVFGEEIAYLTVAMTIPDLPPDLSQEHRFHRYRQSVDHTTKNDPRVLVMRAADLTDNGTGLDFVPNVPLKNLRGKLRRAYKYDGVFDLLSERTEGLEDFLSPEAKRKIIQQMEQGATYSHLLQQLDKITLDCEKGLFSAADARILIRQVINEKSQIVNNPREMEFGFNQLLTNRFLNAA